MNANYESPLDATIRALSRRIALSALMSWNMEIRLRELRRLRAVFRWGLW